MVSRRNIENRHARRRGKKSNIDGLMSNINSIFTNETRGKKDQNKIRKRRIHKIESTPGKRYASVAVVEKKHSKPYKPSHKLKHEKISTFKIEDVLKYNNFDLRTKALFLMCLCSLGFILFYLIPFLFSVYYSLINNPFDKNFVGIKNYIEVIRNHYFRLALKNTFAFTFIGVGILIPVSFILSVIIVNLTKSMNYIKPAFFIPMLLPTASVIVIWKILFGDYSYINDFLNNDTGRLPIYLLFLWKNCGYNIILFSAAFLSVDKFIYEAASLDGVNIFQKHIYITFPLIMPTVFFIFIISLVNSFKIFKEVYLFYGTSYPEQNLYLVQHYMKNHFDKLNYQNLTTGAIIFALFVYIIVAIGYRFQEKVSTEAL